MKPRLIIVDGHARSNKASVAFRIADRLGVNHESCSSETTAPEFVQLLRPVVDGIESVVLESSWRADCVRELLGHSPQIGLVHRRMLDRLAMGCSAIVAQCYTGSLPDWSVEEREFLTKINEAWSQVLVEGPFLGVLVNEGRYEEFDIDLLIDKLGMGDNLGPGIGAWRPGQVILLVGDRHGPSIQPYKVNANVPFIDMAKAGSSFWLTNKLIEAGVPENALYWINAYDSTGIATDPGFVRKLRPITVLTLGDAASRWCDTYHIRYEHFRHPQYHKRFQHGKNYPLIDRLRELFADESSLGARSELKEVHN